MQRANGKDKCSVLVQPQEVQKAQLVVPCYRFIPLQHAIIWLFHKAKEEIGKGLCFCLHATSMRFVRGRVCTLYLYF